MAAPRITRSPTIFFQTLNENEEVSHILSAQEVLKSSSPFVYEVIHNLEIKKILTVDQCEDMAQFFHYLELNSIQNNGHALDSYTLKLYRALATKKITHKELLDLPESIHKDLDLYTNLVDAGKLSWERIKKLSTREINFVHSAYQYLLEGMILIDDQLVQSATPQQLSNLENKDLYEMFKAGKITYANVLNLKNSITFYRTKELIRAGILTVEDSQKLTDKQSLYLLILLPLVLQGKISVDVAINLPTDSIQKLRGIISLVESNHLDLFVAIKLDTEQLSILSKTREMIQSERYSINDLLTTLKGKSDEVLASVCTFSPYIAEGKISLLTAMLSSQFYKKANQLKSLIPTFFSINQLLDILMNPQTPQNLLHKNSPLFLPNYGAEIEIKWLKDGLVTLEQIKNIYATVIDNERANFGLNYFAFVYTIEPLITNKIFKPEELIGLRHEDLTLLAKLTPYFTVGALNGKEFLQSLKQRKDQLISFYERNPLTKPNYLNTLKKFTSLFDIPPHQLSRISKDVCALKDYYESFISKIVAENNQNQCNDVPNSVCLKR